jgi:hypothetical protein
MIRRRTGGRRVAERAGGSFGITVRVCVTGCRCRGRRRRRCFPSSRTECPARCGPSGRGRCWTITASARTRRHRGAGRGPTRGQRPNPVLLGGRPARRGITVAAVRRADHADDPSLRRGRGPSRTGPHLEDVRHSVAGSSVTAASLARRAGAGRSAGSGDRLPSARRRRSATLAILRTAVLRARRFRDKRPLTGRQLTDESANA